MNKKAFFREILERSRKRDNFWVETAILEFTEEMATRMEQIKVSKSQLADRMGVAPAFVTKLLRGNNNFTIETMVKVSRALDADLRLHMQPSGTVSEWLCFLKDKPVVQQPAQLRQWDTTTFTPISTYAPTATRYEPVCAPT